RPFRSAHRMGTICMLVHGILGVEETFYICNGHGHFHPILCGAVTKSIVFDTVFAEPFVNQLERLATGLDEIIHLFEI
ncbi:MAG: hypothetical protein Q9224_007222, partial [Gallowayella concinna]